MDTSLIERPCRIRLFTCSRSTGVAVGTAGHYTAAAIFQPLLHVECRYSLHTVPDTLSEYFTHHEIVNGSKGLVLVWVCWRVRVVGKAYTIGFTQWYQWFGVSFGV